jgi:hypothetical protein
MARPKSLTTRSIFPVRLSAMEKERIEALAIEAGITASEYMRRCALGKRVHSKVNVKAMGELCRLGGLQKLAIMHAPEHRAALNEVLADILLTLKSIRQSGS